MTINRQAATICHALLKFHKVPKARVSDPKFYIMDNECYSDLKEAMKKCEIDFQLEAERAIRTCKNHFIDGLSTTDPYFPIIKWKRLISQCVITLNLLQDYKANPV